MEILELLEQRVEAMLAEINGLRDENRRLQAQVADLQHSLEDAEVVQLQLEEEQENKAEAVARVDRLLKRIEESLTSSDDASAQG